MTYEEENKELLEGILENTFYKDFRNFGNGENKLFAGLELQITSACNLKCSYCYYSKVSGHGQLLNKGGKTWDELLENAEMVFSWLKENKFVPEKIDIFSGDSLIYEPSHKIIKAAIDFYISVGKSGVVVVPSNMTFLKDKYLTEKVVGLIEYAKENNVGFGISASVDGKYADPITRQPIKNVPAKEFYNDEFYETLFAFCKKYHCGLHPMISPENIHVWDQNFGWFQKMMSKYKINWNNIYLLEVRNDGWKKEHIEEYSRFIGKVLDFTFRMIRGREYYVDNFILSSKKNNITNMNLFNNVSVIGRGIGCSLQTTFFVKLSDMTCNSCHRLSYDALNGFQFDIKDKSIVGVVPLNLAFYTATLTLDTKALPYCESCLIKHLCSGGCLGAQLEYTGDAFTPIPSVCALEHAKVKAQVDFYKRKGIFNLVKAKLTKELRLTYEQFERMMQ